MRHSGLAREIACTSCWARHSGSSAFTALKSAWSAALKGPGAGTVPLQFFSIIESERFKALPHRQNIAKLATHGAPLPAEVQRQFPVQDMIGEELAAAITGHKPIDEALADAEHRVNELLFHVL